MRRCANSHPDANPNSYPNRDPSTLHFDLLNEPPSAGTTRATLTRPTSSASFSLESHKSLFNLDLAPFPDFR
jgi:hypothetical protein